MLALPAPRDPGVRSVCLRDNLLTADAGVFLALLKAW
jgi:hypothetical protein